MLKLHIMRNILRPVWRFFTHCYHFIPPERGLTGNMVIKWIIYGDNIILDNGSNPAHNPQLEAIIAKAKSASMPKDKIEQSIKSALRVSFEFKTTINFHRRIQNPVNYLRRSFL